MSSVATAPGKAILLGEHFVVHGTGAILCAIGMRARVESRRIAEREVRVESGALGSIRAGVEPGSEVDPAFRPFVHIARRLLGSGGHGGGVGIRVDSGIPHGAGLGSSSACYAATAYSVMRLLSRGSAAAARDLAVEAERTVFREASGVDTAACAAGGIIECGRDLVAEPIEAGSEMTLVIADTMQKHYTGNMVARAARFKAGSPDRFEELRMEASDLVRRARRALEGGDLRDVGECMGRNHECLREIGVSNGRLDTVAGAVGGACYGAKLTGAGGGGCIVAAADGSNARDAERAAAGAGCRCYTTKISYSGLE